MQHADPNHGFQFTTHFLSPSNARSACQLVSLPGSLAFQQGRDVMCYKCGQFFSTHRTQVLFLATQPAEKEKEEEDFLFYFHLIKLMLVIKNGLLENLMCHV